MGRRPRLKPERLAEKLVHIRTALGISQSEMHRQLGLGDMIDAKRISEYELGNNEPPLPVVLGYARVAGVNMEALVDDELALPDRLPGDAEHEAIKRKYAPRRKSKR